MPETPAESDQTALLVERIAADLASIRWASPTELRNRARHRARRRAVSGAVVLTAVVVAVFAVVPLANTAGRVPSPMVASPVSSGAVVGPRVPPDGEPVRPAPSRHGTASPLATDRADPVEPGIRPTGQGVPISIPAEALLQPRDVGADVLLGLTEASDFEPVQPIAGSLTSCPDYPALDRYDGVAVALRRHALLRDPKQGEPVLRQEVGRFPNGAAGRIVTDVEQAVSVCARYWSPGLSFERSLLDGWGEHRWSRTDRDFAGDQSLLLRHEIAREDAPTVVVYLVAVVRVGDLVTVVTSAGLTRERARLLAVVAASRLCRSANPAC